MRIPPPYRKGLSSRRRTTLFFLLLFAISNIWGEDYLINVESSNLSNDSKWYEVESVGGVTNKTGSTWSSADYACTPTGAKTGSSNFTIRTDKDNTTEIKVNVSSTSKRTISSVKTSTSLSSFSEATNCTPNGTVTKNTCDQVLTFTFNPAINAGTYVNIAVSGNLNVHAVTITTTSASTPEPEPEPEPDVATYTVTYDLNGGTGAAPTQPSVAENGTFTVASAEGITSPAGKEFAGWSDGTNTYNAGDTYTMGAAAVTFTAQWKAAPTVLFHYQQSNLSGSLAADTYSALGGTLTTSASMSKESASYNSSVPSDLRGGANVSKLGSNSNYIQITLATGNFVEGDTIYICGYKPYKISTTADLSGDIVNSLTTGTAKGDYNIGYIVLPAGVEQNTIYLSRAEGTGTGFAAIKVIRPAQKEILSTDITLSAVIVNTEAISAENLATLKADPYKLDLTSEYAEAPTIAFTKQTVITYEDATTKTKTEAIEVAAIEVDGKWQAQTEINAITYTVTALIPATYTVIYKDGETILASETVKVGEHPTAAGVTTNPHYSLSWKLAEEIVELASVDGTADQEIILTAVWTPKYATSLDFAAITTAGTTEDNPIVDFLASGNMIASNLGSSEWETSTSKSGYVGYKLKNSGATITFLAQEDKRVTITFGSIAADVTLKKGDETVTISAQSGDGAETVYNLDVTTDMVVAITTSSGSTVTLKSITIGEIPTISDDATLKDLKVNGTTIAGFNSATKIYYLTVPYGTEVANMPKITEATANHASATAVIYPEEGPEWKEEYGCYLQQVVVTAEDGITKGYYHVRTTVDAKEGVTIIKATHTDATTADVIGAIGGTCDKKTQADGKLGSNGHYFGIKLAEGTFKSGDVIKVVASALNGGNTITLFADNEGTTEIGSVAYDQTTKTAYFTLTADVENVYIYRVSSACNSNVEYIEVQRYMAPFIESFVIGEAKGNIDQANKTIAVEVSARTDVTALTPTIVAWANGGATVTPTGAQDFTSPVTYKVSSAYAEDGITTYTVTVTQAAASADATLATLTYNGTNITLVPDQYTYDIELPKGTTVVPTVTYTTNHTRATAVKTDAAVLPGATTIIVTAEDGTTQQNYTINFTVSRAISYVIYDGSVQQNIEKSGTEPINWSLTNPTNTDGEKAEVTCNDKYYTKCVKVFSSATTETDRYMTIEVPTGYMAKFYLAGATNSNGKERSLFISKEITGTLDQSIAYSTSSTYEGAAMMSDYQMPGTYYLCCNASIRLYELSVVLYPIDYERPVRQGYYGTICLPNKGQMIGAAVYEIAYMDYKDGAPYKIYFDEILNGKMEAGVPYVFLPNEGYNQLIVTYTAIINAAAAEVNGLCGFIGTEATDEYQIPSGVGNYIIQNNQYREVLADAKAFIVSNRAYIKLSEVPGYNNPLYVAPAPAPGRKRIAMGTTGAQVATGVDQVQGDEVPTKMIINGQLFILRGEKMYDAQGKLVK